MSEVNASIITIGDELLIGQTVDTNSAFIAQELNKIGIWVKHRIAVGDVYEDIWNALDEESKQADLIIITGGLGPTADDITKPLLCTYFGGKLVIDEKVLQHVQYLFEKVFNRPGPLLQRNVMQAEVPDVCTVLHNAHGTAPGMWFEKIIEGSKKIFISLPGVPHEMRGLMIDEVLPRLLQTFTLPAIIHKHAFTAGLGEAMLAERLQSFENTLPHHIKLAYLPTYGMVRLRLTAKGDDKNALEKEIDSYYQEMLSHIEDILVSGNNDPLENTVGKILQNRNKTLATAESCTGGHIAHLITSVPGASAYFKGSIVAYDNEVKENILHVKADTLQTHGAVSEATIIQMVQGALQTLHTDYALATSGIMGPDGGTPEKPVGTVWIAAGNAHTIKTKLLQLRFDRERNINFTAQHALNFLRAFMLGQADAH